MDNRTDKGELFENSVYLNLLHKKDVLTDIKYWKSKTRQEIDFVVIRNNEITAYEAKYGSDNNNHFTAFTKLYPSAKCYIVRFNYAFNQNELPGYF